jgi:multiple sugar transport system ATP-binding protein
MSDGSVKIKDLVKTYADDRGRPTVTVVKHINLNIEDGEFMVLLGPAGSGKTTMVRMVGGLERMTSGTIEIGGEVVNDLKSKDRGVAMVFQNYALYPHMAIFENMAFGLELAKKKKDFISDIVGRTAEALGLAYMLERKPQALSGGQRHRIALGRAIVRRPKVFLFDEPLSNLDAKMRVQMRSEILRLHDQLGATMIYVTHDQVEAMTMADRICVMRDGLIMQVADPLTLYRRPENLFVASFIGSPPMNLLRGKVHKRDRGLFFIENAAENALTIPLQGLLERKYVGREIVFGIRPEHLSNEIVDAPLTQVTSTVEITEQMGSESFLYLKTGTARLIARMHGEHEYHSGEQATVQLRLDKVHLFDPETENVIWYQPATELDLVTLSGDEPLVAEEGLEARRTAELAAQIGDKLENPDDEATERQMFDVFETRVGSGAGDEPPPPAPLRPALEPQRYLVARADDRVKVGVPFTLTARISTENLPSVPGQGGAPVTGDVTGKLKISIYAPGFTSNDGTQREIDVPAAGNSSWVPFELVGTKEGIHLIEVLAWKNSAQVGGVAISIGVGSEQAGDGSVQSGIDMREPEEGEYTLEVVFERVLNAYRFQLRSDIGENWPSMYSDPLEGALWQTYSAVMSNLNTQARNANQLSEFAQGEWLKGMGATLYKSLVPSELKQALWENRNNIKYLNILSRAEPMPWELLYISNPAGTAGGEFIADAATVTRWRYGPPAGRQISKKNPYFVLPNGSPTKAQEEVTYARKKLGVGNIVDQLDDLLLLLIAGQFSLLHFASHNVANPTTTGGLYIPFGSSKFDIAFMGAWSKNQFRSQHPLVFMNSCTSGGAVPLYTDMAGWAEKFLEAGCGAFIGSLWEIRDASALTFAEHFYDEFTGGKNLGESIRAARSVLKRSDPTYLAYTLYGNPLAKFS